MRPHTGPASTCERSSTRTPASGGPSGVLGMVSILLHMQPEQFRIEFTDSAVADLRDRIGRTRWPGDYGNDEWKYGANEDWMQESPRTGATDSTSPVRGRGHRWDHFLVGRRRSHPLHPRRGKLPEPTALVLTRVAVAFWGFQRRGTLLVAAAYGGDPADALT